MTSIEMGNGIQRDFFGSYFNNVNDKLEEICESLKSDEQLKDGFSFVTFSQGGQFARALVQRCNIKVLNLITLGAQHQGISDFKRFAICIFTHCIFLNLFVLKKKGIFGIPRCPSEKRYICLITDRLFNIGFYTNAVQSRFVPAQYWHDAMNYENYRLHSQFIAEINQEVKSVPIYKERLIKLKRFVMIKFENDSIVDPIESEHFGFFEYGNLSRIIKLEESSLYIEDRLGLQVLDKSNRLIKISLPGDHLQISRDWFKTEIINKYIKSEINLN